MACYRYRGRQSQSSSDTAVGDFRCSADNGCCGDDTNRMPGICVGVSWAFQMMSMPMLDLLKMLTLRPQRYEPEAFALCTRLLCLPCNLNLGGFAERLQDG